MNFDFVTIWFLSVFPDGKEIVKLVGSIGHAFTSALLLYLCLLMFSVLVRVIIPPNTKQQLRLRTGGEKAALSLMQAISSVAFAIQIGYLVMQEPWLSFAMLMGFSYIVITNAVFLLGVRFVLPNLIKGMLARNRITSGITIGLLHLAWAIIMLGSMASRY